MPRAKNTNIVTKNSFTTHIVCIISPSLSLALTPHWTAADMWWVGVADKLTRRMYHTHHWAWVGAKDREMLHTPLSSIRYRPWQLSSHCKWQDNWKKSNGEAAQGMSVIDASQYWHSIASSYSDCSSNIYAICINNQSVMSDPNTVAVAWATVQWVARMTAIEKSIAFLNENYSTSSDGNNWDKQSGGGVSLWLWKTREGENKAITWQWWQGIGL